MRMNENRAFYRKQFEWMKDTFVQRESAYLSFAESRCKKVLAETKPTGKRFLEIGSGAGFEAGVFSAMGYQVDAVELDPELVHFAENRLQRQALRPEIILGDFLSHPFADRYDLIYYLDGFGVGDPADQEAFLARIGRLLNGSTGTAYIDIYNKRYWKEAHGVSMKLMGTVQRVYSFESDGNVMVDRWRDSETGESAEQRLCCYDLDEIVRMSRRAGLDVVKAVSGGRMDYQEMRWLDKAGLDDCMAFSIVVKKREMH